jgi:hypothetical protein
VIVLVPEKNVSVGQGKEGYCGQRNQEEETGLKKTSRLEPDSFPVTLGSSEKASVVPERRDYYRLPE